jgi:SAM-dependent methyltransferase
MDASAWDERYAATGLVWGGGPNQFVEAELAALPRGKAVDLAAGEGRNAIWLAARGWQVMAVDFSQVALDKGRRLAGPSSGSGTSSVEPGTGGAVECSGTSSVEPGTGGAVEWVRADATTWDGSGLDLAVVAYLQLPAAERRLAMRNAFRALRAGGTFLVVAHDSTNLAEGTGGPQDPAVLYTAEDVLSDLEGEDVEVLRAERVPRVVASADGHGPAGTAWDALVRLRRRS